ncbi:MAG TPA: hypothetical protein VIY71_00850 [Solirubrobacterales bacterium]
MKLIRKRLTYANVMSSIAVFLILGGATAFAAKKIGSNEIKGNSITTGKIKKEAVSTAKIKKNAISTDKIQNDAVTGDKVKESSLSEVPLAANAANASKLGGAAPSAYQGRVQWALIAANGTVIQQSGGISAVKHGGPTFGTYNVTFPSAIDNSALSVTLSDIDASFGGSPIVSPCAGPGAIGPIFCEGDAGKNNVAFVDTPNQANSAPVAHAFYIQATP